MSNQLGRAAALVAVSILAGPPVRAEPVTPSFLALGDEIVATVRDHFFDEAKARDWARRHHGYGAGAIDRAAFVAATDRILAELATSHTAYYPVGGREHPMLAAIFAAGLKAHPVHVSLGLDVAYTPDGAFARRVFPGGPAEAAGVLRGDRLLSVDGEVPDATRPLASQADHPVQLRVQRTPAQPVFVLTAVPRAVDPKMEWLAMQRTGSTVVERNGERVAYHPIFSGAGPEPETALREALQGTLAGAGALVLDLRDGWGGCRAELVELFSPITPTVVAIRRGGKSTTAASAWHKPVVLLVNGGSRSGKEIVAFALKHQRTALLVGARTAGAVMTGQAFELADGSLLYVAVADIRVNGQRLEGAGVEPHVAVPDALLYAQGKDPQLERAFELAAQEARKRRTAGR